LEYLLLYLAFSCWRSLCLKAIIANSGQQIKHLFLRQFHAMGRCVCRDEFYWLALVYQHRVATLAEHDAASRGRRPLLTVLPLAGAIDTGQIHPIAI